MKKSVPFPHSSDICFQFEAFLVQASDTFVTHSRANFYFLLTPETQEMSEFKSSSLKRKPSRRRRQEARARDAPAADSASADSAGGTDLRSQDQRDTDTDRTDHDSSVDSTKQMKGIINMQIKENR